MSTVASNEQRPLRRDAERNRQRIMGAARALFCERGLDVSHDEIAQAAEVGVGTVYRRFPDRETLIDALFAEQVDEVVDIARAAVELTDPWSGLVMFLTETIQRQSCDRGFKELLMGTSRSTRLAAYASELIAPVVHELVARAQRTGQLRPDVGVHDIALVPIMVGGVIDSSREVNPLLWERALALVLEGLRAREQADLPGRPPTRAEHEKIMAGWYPPRH